ncbi:class C sortase [Corynebacterium sphenisci]|uniref:class C sortase n=1 Tax=Corynebacterium sphenisci TaxID=191493 RepID=UPI0026E03644|nr:class C sortase [Corynebacterium sphenisci]MDO5730970.1 class C sortase [Corynebacterium sphenisci]
MDAADTGVIVEGTRAEPSRRRARTVLAPALLVLLGLLVLLYPVVATQWNNAKQLRAAREYSRIEQNTDPERLSAAWESARRYNAERASGPILDPWLARVGQDNADYQAYLAELNQQQAMARLVVPAATVDLPVYHGSTEKTLQRGVGHLYGTDLPVGGEGTHAVLTAHTGLANATLFDNLTDVHAGDAIYVAVAGQRLKYEVESTEVVLPEETDSLAPVADEDLITLVTCTPYGINTHRLLVTGHRVPMDPADAAGFADSGLHWQWWMWAILAAALLILARLAWWLIRAPRGRRAEAGTDPDRDPDGDSAATEEHDR